MENQSEVINRPTMRIPNVKKSIADAIRELTQEQFMLEIKRQQDYNNSQLRTSK